MVMPQDLARAQSGLVPAGDVQVFFDRGLTLVRLSGCVDLALGPELEDAGRDAIDRALPIRVDAGHLRFVDSIGLGFLARLAAAGHQQGWRLVIVGSSRIVSDAVRVTNLASLVDLVES